MDSIYLVTGVSGHIGNAVARRLVAEGGTVRGLVFRAKGVEKKLPSAVEIFRADITDLESLRPFFQVPVGRTIKVIHSAGIISITSKVQPQMEFTNIEGLKNVIALCDEVKAKKLVYISSVDAIPPHPKGMTISEVQDFDSTLVRSPYAKTKARATALALEAAARGLDVTVVQPSAVLGPYDYGRGHVTQMVIDYCTGRLFAGIKGAHDFVDVRDVAKGIVAATDKGKTGQCYILSNQQYTVAEIFALLHQITGKRKIKLMLPLQLILTIAPLIEFYYRLRRTPPLFTVHSLAALSGNTLFSHRKAAVELGYTTRPLEDTLRETIEWLKEAGRLGRYGQVAG